MQIENRDQALWVITANNQNLIGFAKMSTNNGHVKDVYSPIHIDIADKRSGRAAFSKIRAQHGDIEDIDDVISIEVPRPGR